MPERMARADVFLEAGPEARGREVKPLPETPFEVALLGDFSGRTSRRDFRSSRDLSVIKPLVVDRDNIDELVEGLRVELEMPVAGRIRFRSLDDFHPDRLYRELPLFSKLHEALDEARKPSTTPTMPRQRATRTPDLSLDGLLDAAVEQTTGSGSGESQVPKDGLREWLDDRVAPHLERGPTEEQARLIELVQQTAAAQMRALLHFPAFQALEAAWRAVFFLVRRLDTGPLLKIRLIDVAREELANDLQSADTPGDSAVYRLLRDSLEDSPWAVLAGDYTFGVSEDDLLLLARMGNVARALGAPWIAGGAATLAGCRSLAGTPDPDDWEPEPALVWRRLRELPVATSVGLALPRFLLRRPYGRQTEPCEDLEFEELSEGRDHERYLWGNPAFACVYLMARAFDRGGWDALPTDEPRIDHLPLHTFEKDGEWTSQPCAETLLSLRAVERLLDIGLMPLASIRDTDSIRLGRFQSLADPPSPLAAWWAR